MDNFEKKEFIDRIKKDGINNLDDALDLLIIIEEGYPNLVILDTYLNHIINKFENNYTCKDCVFFCKCVEVSKSWYLQIEADDKPCMAFSKR